LTIGLFLPVTYANGVASYPGWMIFGILIGLSCYFFSFISYVEIERNIQTEKFSRQTVVFAGIFCRTVFDIFFGSMDVKISSKTLIMSPNNSTGRKFLPALAA